MKVERENPILKKFFKKITEYVPVWVTVIAAIAIVCGVIHIISGTSTAFADLFNENVSSHFRAVLAYISGIVPFSIAEGLIMFIPVLLVLLIYLSIKYASDSWRSIIRYTSSIFSVVLLFYIFFVFGFATAYQGSTIEEKLELDRRDVSAEELEKTASRLLEMASENLEEVYFVYGGASVMPYSLDEMEEKLLDAYEKACDKYPFVQRLRSDLKPIILSEPMTYTHISGVYSYFTGEANLNTNFPDYTLPYTAAHEFSHQRGIAREDEANFMAFLVCLESDDPYIRYSGCLSVYEYVASALYSADPDRYYSVLSGMDMRIRCELVAYSEFFDKYRENVVSDVSGAINDTYLKLQGTEGSRSYGRVVDLAVAYFKDN